MTLSAHLKAEREYVEKQLGQDVICKHCGATLDTYADKCTADLSEICPGFEKVEKAKEAFGRTR